MLFLQIFERVWELYPILFSSFYSDYILDVCPEAYIYVQALFWIKLNVTKNEMLAKYC